MHILEYVHVYNHGSVGYVVKLFIPSSKEQRAEGIHSLAQHVMYFLPVLRTQCFMRIVV